jgi:hypothetical protein
MAGEEENAPERGAKASDWISPKAEADLRDCTIRVARLEVQLREIRELLSSIAEPRRTG